MDAFLRREGDVWVIQWGGRPARVRDSKGLRHLAVLLARPGTEVHCLELAGAPGAVTSADAAPLLDDRARAAYKERLGDLASDLDEAESFNDGERAARIQAEIDALVDQLTAAAGLGGRDRGAVTDAERARVAVRRAVKSALDRVAEANPALGEHFAATVRTGTYCAYVPDPASPVRWLIGDAGADAGDGSDGGPPRAPRPAPPVVVGRDQEQAALARAWQTGGLVLLAGEPGIGKTTLLRDLAAKVDVAVAGRCEDHLGIPYQPIVETIRALVAIDGAAAVIGDAGVGAAALARIVPELGVHGTAGDADEERVLLYDAVARVFAGASRRRRLLVTVDDLHWAPQPTLALLLHVVRELEGCASLVVVTFRDTEVGDDLLSFLAACARTEGVVRLALRGLDTDAIVELGASADEAKRLFEHTAGNPFFVRALLDAPRSDTLPATVLDVVADRVRRLSPGARRLLSLAAVAGDRLPARVATSLAGDLDAIDEVLAARLLLEDGESIAFPHALVRRAITEQTSGVRQAALHGEVAAALETAGAPAAELAFHFAAAGNRGPAVRYATEAATSALRAMAHEEAVVHAEHGLALVPAGTAEHCRLLLVLGEAHHSGGDIPAAHGALDEAGAIAAALGDRAMLADVALERADRGAQVGLDDPEVAAALARAIDLLGNSDPLRRARLLARLAVVRSVSGQIDEGRRLAVEAVALAREAGDEGVLVTALHAEERVFDAPEHLDRRRALTTEIDARARARGDIGMQVSAAGARFTIACELADVVALDAALDDLHRLTQLTRIPRHQWYDLELQVVRGVIAGDLERAEELADREYGVGVAASVPNAWRGYTLQLLVIRHEQGRAGELAEIAIEMASADRDARTAMMAALACHAAGRTDDARALLDGIDLAALPRDTLLLGVLCVAAELSLHLVDTARAAVIDGQLRPFAGRCCSIALGTISIGPVDRYLSYTARAQGDLARAEHHLRDAIALDERLGARRWLQRDTDDLAALLATAAT